MIQEMAMMEARSDDLAAKLRQAEEKNNEMDRNQEAQKKEFEVRAVGEEQALGKSVDQMPCCLKNCEKGPGGWGGGSERVRSLQNMSGN